MTSFYTFCGGMVSGTAIAVVSNPMLGTLVGLCLIFPALHMALADKFE
jgi:hypothetical protein